MSRWIGVPNLRDETVWINTAHIVWVEHEDGKTTVRTTGGDGMGAAIVRTRCDAKEIMLAALDPNSVYKEVNK